MENFKKLQSELIEKINNSGNLGDGHKDMYEDIVSGCQNENDLILQIVNFFEQLENNHSAISDLHA